MALVTGAGGGIGRSVSLSLAASGCEVITCDIDTNHATATATEAEKRGGRSRVLSLDVTDADAVRTALAVEAQIDHVVTCAGMVRTGAIAEIDEDDWGLPFTLNVDGVMHIARAVHPLLARSTGASVVNIGSTCGTSAYPGGGGYGPSKAALIALSQQMAAEWGRDGIRVNVVNPGPTKTPAAAGDAVTRGSGPPGSPATRRATFRTRRTSLMRCCSCCRPGPGRSRASH